MLDRHQQTKSRLQKELQEKHNDLLRKQEEILQLRSRSQIIDRSAADVRSATNSAIKAHKKAAANELAGANSAVAAMEKVGQLFAHQREQRCWPHLLAVSSLVRSQAAAGGVTEASSPPQLNPRHHRRHHHLDFALRS